MAGLKLTQKASNRQFSFSPNTERRTDYQGSEEKAEERHGPLCYACHALNLPVMGTWFVNLSTHGVCLLHPQQSN